MANTYTTLNALFTAIANAIRTKTGSSATIKADDFPTAISNIPSGKFYQGTVDISASARTIAFSTGVDFTSACKFIIAPVSVTTVQAVAQSQPFMFSYDGTTLKGYYQSASGTGSILYEFAPSLISVNSTIQVAWSTTYGFIPRTTYMIVAFEG